MSYSYTGTGVFLTGFEFRTSAILFIASAASFLLSSFSATFFAAASPDQDIQQLSFVPPIYKQK